MKGGHDLGGRQGPGPINPEPEEQEPVFHADWERRVFALTLASGMLGKWNIDESRHARERQESTAYLRNSYYENWLVGLEKLLVEKGLLQQDELGEGMVGTADAAIDKLRVPDASAIEKILRSGGPTLLVADTVPAYASGASVQVIKSSATGHTRVPGYVQGSIGVVVAHHGCHVFPDKNALGEHVGEQLYAVRFSAIELWGSSAENADVMIDLWEPYLEPVSK